jgi:arylsulfatase A-like enzyme
MKSSRLILRIPRIFFVALGLLFVMNLGQCRRSPSETNVILIIIDTLRQDHVSCYGYKRETTANLDALAREGVRFEQAISSCPWTLPSIASILTGQNPSTHQAGIHLDPYTMEDRRLSVMNESIVTLAEVFQQKGYSTVGFFQNPFVHPEFGLNRGFDLYDYAPGDNRNIRRANIVVARAMQWLEDREKSKKGFFMVLHLFDPHLAYDPTVEFIAPYTYGYKGKLVPPFDPKLKDIRSGKVVLSSEDKEFAIGLYDGEIAFADASLGAFFGYLKNNGLYDTSLIIATSDHGEEFWDHSGFEHGHTLHWEVLNVPLIMRFPHALNAGQVIKERVSLTDLFPSILGFLGWAVPVQTSGESFISRSDAISVQPHIIISENLHFGPQQQCFYASNYKMIINQFGRIEVYNLDKDPLEMKNVFGKDRDFPEEIRNQIEHIAREMKELLKEPKRAAELDKETKNKLKALGYLK